MHKNPMKHVLSFLGVCLVVVLVVWVFGALQAGLFLEHAQAAASQADESSIEGFSREKKFADIDGWRVAYIERGFGEPVVLLHGCPFQSFEYSKVIPSLARHYRMIAPDLLGLGDTIVPLDGDYRLPNQVTHGRGVAGSARHWTRSFVGHDHGGAIVQLMMNSHADRLGAVILTNVEAYDQWPSDPERLDVELIVHPLSTSFFRVALGVPAIQRRVLSIAVHRSEVLTDDVIHGLSARSHVRVGGSTTGASTRRYRSRHHVMATSRFGASSTGGSSESSASCIPFTSTSSRSRCWSGTADRRFLTKRVGRTRWLWIGTKTSA